MTEGLKVLLALAIIGFIPIAWVLSDGISMRVLYPNCVNAEDRQLCIQLESLRGVLSE